MKPSDETPQMKVSKVIREDDQGKYLEVQTAPIQGQMTVKPIPQHSEEVFVEVRCQHCTGTAFHISVQHTGMDHVYRLHCAYCGSKMYDDVVVHE